MKESRGQRHPAAPRCRWPEKTCVWVVLTQAWCSARMPTLGCLLHCCQLGSQGNPRHQMSSNSTVTRN